MSDGTELVMKCVVNDGTAVVYVEDRELELEIRRVEGVLSVTVWERDGPTIAVATYPQPTKGGTP